MSNPRATFFALIVQIDYFCSIEFIFLFTFLILHNMKRILLPLAAVLCLTATADAQKLVPQQKINAAELKATLNPSDVTFLATPNTVDGLFDGVAPAAALPARRAPLARLDAAEVDTVSYFAVAQSFHNGYTFNYEGGDIFTYNVGLALDGTKATFTNLFNMLAASADSYYQSYDYPVDGVYDADAKTITIATGTTGVACGNYMGGYYTAMLLAGTVNETGTLTPAEELVFDVTVNEDGTIATITSRTSFLARYDYGNIRVYKSFTAVLPNAEVANVITFTESIDFGECFVGTSSTKGFQLINTGGKDADFVIELEAEDDAFTSAVTGGTVPAQGTLDLSFDFLANKAGAYEGIVTITYDNGAGESTLVVDLAGSAKDYPDYSAVIKSGNFTATTGIEYPFEIVPLEDGTIVASSTTYGAYGSSWLNLAFSVPEGKLATVAWKGVSNNVSYWYYNAGGYFIDTLNGAKASFQGANEDMSGNWEFAPGDHFIRFQYDGNYYSGLAENRLYVYDIEYTEATLNADSAAVLTPEVALGNAILPVGGTVTKNGFITVKNLGANALTISSVTSDNEEFTADISGLTEAATMQEVNIPIAMEAKASGEKSATYTIVTSAGTFTAQVTASVMDMPDFASLVVEGAEYITSWTMNESYPFVIVDGKATNKNAGDNSAYATAYFQMDLTVPEGKIAYVTWDGQMWGRPITEGSYEYQYSSYATYNVSHPMTSGSKTAYGSDGADASSDVFANDPFWADYLACIPGKHYYQWGWYHNGDGTVPEGDKIEISNIRIKVSDFNETGVELLDPEVTFEDTYVGPNRYKTAVVRLHNTGSNALSVSAINGEAPFYGIETTEVAQFNKIINVTLWFYPEEAGTYDGKVTITTSAGDVEVVCHGTALDPAAEGFILLGDFEDDAAGWTAADPDGDGETWNLGSNLWGDRPEYCHSGSQCLASISYSNYLGAIEPDNWTLSPIISMPADGSATLSYYIAAFSPSRWAEHYSLYIAEYDAEAGLDIQQVALTDPVCSETLTEEAGAMDGWQYREVDMADYMGKQIVLLFRHHDCNGQYIIRLDDVNILHVQQPDAIRSIDAVEAPEAVQIYTVDGRKANGMVNGINIVRKNNADGSVSVQKIMK